jgi:TrmH family RNA methyltransferase
MKLIQSRDNPQFKALLKLARSARERRITHEMFLDGDHLIEACCDAGIEISMLAIAESGLKKPQKRDLFEKTNADVRMVLADQLLAMISQVVTASGLVAVAVIPKPKPFPVKAETCLMLESVQDPGNIGTILRTAVAAGVGHVALSPGCASAWSPKAIRAGMGGQFLLNIHEQVDLASLLKSYQGHAIATKADASLTLYDADLSGPVAWLFGNEGAGLSPTLSAFTQVIVSIPMKGPVESLNVASAVAICLFEQLRQVRAILN